MPQANVYGGANDDPTSSISSISPSFRHSRFLKERSFQTAAKSEVSIWYCIRDVFTLSYRDFHHEKVARCSDFDVPLRTLLLNEYANVALVAAVILSSAVAIFLFNAENRELFGVDEDQGSGATTHYFISMSLLYGLALLMTLSVFMSLMCMSVVSLMVEEEVPRLISAAGFVLKLPGALLLDSLFIMAPAGGYLISFYVNNHFCAAWGFVSGFFVIFFTFASAYLVRASYQSVDLVRLDQARAPETPSGSTSEQQGQCVMQRDDVTPEDNRPRPQLELHSSRCSFSDDQPPYMILDCIISSEWLPVPPQVGLDACACGQSLQMADARICARCGALVCSSCGDKHKSEVCASRQLKILARSTCRCSSMPSHMQGASQQILLERNFIPDPNGGTKGAICSSLESPLEQVQLSLQPDVNMPRGTFRL